MAPILNHIASMAESLVSRQYEMEHTHSPPPKDYTPFVVAIVMLALAWSTIVLRLYTRIRLISAIGWDDATMIIALLCFTTYAGADMTLSIKRTELEFMTYNEILQVVTAWMVVDACYCATVLFLKISVGIFLLRIIIKKHQRWIVYGTMAVSTLVSTATMFFAIFQCGVPKGAGNYIMKRVFGQCVSGESVLGMTFTLACVTALSDFIFTILPIFILKDAKMNKRAKWSLGLILGLGGLGSIASLARFAYISPMKEVNNDFFVTTAKLSIWSTFECGLGIAAGSLATLRPLFRKFLGGVRNSIITTKTQISRVRSRYSYAKGPGSGGSPGSPRSSMGKHSRSTSGSSNGSSHTRVGSRGSRGASIDFAFLKKPFHFRKGSEDLEIGCRGESPLTPLGMSGVFDGKTGDGSKLGTQTTITVGMVQPPANAHKHSFSHSRNYAPSEMSEYDYPGRLGFGMIEKETVFETMSEKCGDVEVDEKELDSEKGSSDASSSIYSRDTCGKPQDLPKAWL